MDEEGSTKNVNKNTAGEPENEGKHSQDTLLPHQKNSHVTTILQEKHLHKDLSPEGTGEELIPPDGGWGWLVAIGAFVITTLLAMVGPCFGILFSRYLIELRTSSTVTAWIFNILCFTWYMFGLVTRPLTQEFGWRRVGIVGAMTASLSLVISAFAPTAEFLFFSFSILCGAGGGAVVCICFTIVPLYFDRKRGQANAIMISGVCLGQIINPPLVNFLQEEYGYRGATMLVGVIMLNACVGALLFHPIEWHQKKKPREVIISLLSSHTTGHMLPKRKGASHETLENQTLGSVASPTEDTGSPKLTVRRGSGPVPPTGEMSFELSTTEFSDDICVMDARIEFDGEKLSGEDIKGSYSIVRILRRVFSSTWSDLCVLKNPRALIIAIGGTLCLNSYLNFAMMVPFAMQANGYTLQDSAYCISVSAVCNLLLRFLVSFLSDWKWFNVRACYMAGIGIISITTFVFPALTDLRWMITAMAIWGCGVGANMGVYNLVMIKMMGIDQLTAVFGSCSFIVGIGFIVFGPSIGFVRDMTESYKISMWLLATMPLLSLFLWVIMPAPKVDRPATEKEGVTKP